MKFRKEKVLSNLLVGTGVYLLDTLRDRLSEGIGDISDRARDTYDEASKRAGRAYDEASRRASHASDAIRGEDHHGIGTAAALLLGIGIGVGVGMLLAPASGEETRGNLSNKVQEFGDRVRDRFSEQQQRREPGSASYGT
jgi:YtxH-like protein